MTINHASIPSSQIAASNRMDAGYHLAHRRAQSRLPLFADLPAQQAKDKALELIAASSTQILAQALGPLVAGSAARAGSTRRNARDMAAAHPHLSLALLHKYLPEIIQHQREQLQQAQKSTQATLDFSRQYPVPGIAQRAHKPGPKPGA